MCGIAGIISNNTITKKEIEAMTLAISHRGPDGFGYYFGDFFAFGHRRLAIVDVSDAGHQPMSFIDRYVITYNGEVYNHIELRKELEGFGYSFNSQSDTEVIMAAFDLWGEDCVNHFNGMWSFALFDKRNNTIFCSRDRFGIKPFYYAQPSGKFVFGSEIKQLLPFFEKRFANKKVLLDYLVIGLSEHTQETFFCGILALAGGHNLTYNLTTKSFKITSYYSLKVDLDLSNLSEAQTIERYKSELLRSVGWRLRSDVPVGTCLSGGLDSSSIASIASKLYQLDSTNLFKGIHAKSSERATDEGAFASVVANSQRIELHTITPTVKDFKDLLAEVFYVQEEPFGSPSIFMQYLVLRKAKELGCKVLLDGQGGDETLLGYERYYPAYLLSLPLLQAIKGFFLSKNNSKLSVAELFGYCCYFLLYPLRKWRLRRRFSFLKNECFSNLEWLKRISKSYLSIGKLQKLEIFHSQLPHLLRYEDKNSMFHSVEARLPFLDFKLLETSLSLNDKYKIRNGWTKYLLRKSMEGDLPDEVVWRKNKLGFDAPERTWINSIMSDIDSTIKNSRIIKQISKKTVTTKSLDIKALWRLYSLAKWEEIYDVQLP